jgi:sporulation protein YlmC with PRC-barrel domain
MNEDQEQAKWSAAEWHGKMLVDRNGEKIGKLQDVYVDVETDEPQFATVKEGLIGRHLTFVPLSGIHVGPDDLQVEVTKEQVRSAPDIEMHGEELSQEDESALYHHFEQNYTPPDTESGPGSPAAERRVETLFSPEPCSHRNLTHGFPG